jgi:hypothetical protein
VSWVKNTASGFLPATKRLDGSIVVAARFRVDRQDAASAVAECISRWDAQKAALGIDTGADLATPPHAEELDKASIEIVFEGKPGSRLWKDWLVDLTRDVTETVDGLHFEGFVDRVSGVVRPV